MSEYANKKMIEYKHKYNKAKLDYDMLVSNLYEMYEEYVLGYVSEDECFKNMQDFLVDLAWKE